MKPPKLIYVGHFDYEVKHTAKGLATDLFGETDNTNSEIRIHSKQSDPNKRDTLMHEVLHAIFFTSGLKRVFEWGDETEEKIIRLLTPWLLQLLQENPALVAYLTNATVIE